MGENEIKIEEKTESFFVGRNESSTSTLRIFIHLNSECSEEKKNSMLNQKVSCHSESTFCDTRWCLESQQKDFS